MKISAAMEKLKRVGASVSIVTTVAGVPMTKDASPDLVKSFEKYSKFQTTDRNTRIRRNTTKTLTPSTALDKRNAKRLRK